MRNHVFRVLMAGMLTAALVGASGSTTFAGAFDEAQKLRESGQQAAGSAGGSHPSYEGARTQAGSGWDSQYQSPPPPVHLPSHNVGVNPQDLKQYDPKPGKLEKVSPPPPSSN